MTKVHLLKTTPPKTRPELMALIRRLYEVAVNKEIVYVEISYKVKGNRSKLESISLDVG